MKSFSVISTNIVFERFIRIVVAAVIASFFLILPIQAHHPFEGNPSEGFSFIQGLLSGLAHPIVGLDHFLFLLSIGLVGDFTTKKWVPLLLCVGLVGSSLAVLFPSPPFPEVLVGMTLLAAAIVFLQRLKILWMLPLIACHGYVLGQPMIGAEPTPLVSYLIGLLFSETLLILGGLAFFRRYINQKGIFVGTLIGAGIVFTYGAVLAFV